MKFRDALAMLGRKTILGVWAIVYIVCIITALIFPGNIPTGLNFYLTTFAVVIVMLPLYLLTAQECDKNNTYKVKDGYIIKEVKK